MSQGEKKVLFLVFKLFCQLLSKNFILFRLSWRRFALDSKEKDKPDSDEEILDINMKPFEPIPSSSSLSPPARSTNSPVISLDENSSYNISSGSDTEDELERVRQKKLQQTMQNNNTIKAASDLEDDIYNKTTDEEPPKCNAFKSRSISPLPDFFKSKVFYLSSNLGNVDVLKLRRFITAYGGSETKLASEASFIISNSPKSVPSGFVGEIVKPLWVYECNDMECLLPTKRYKF